MPDPLPSEPSVGVSSVREQLSVLVVDLGVADDVLQVPEREAVPDDARLLERRVLALRDDLRPARALGVRRVDAEDAVLRRSLVRPHEEAVPVDVDVVDRVLPDDERLPRGLGRAQVHEVDVVARPSVLRRRATSQRPFFDRLASRNVFGSPVRS